MKTTRVEEKEGDDDERLKGKLACVEKKTNTKHTQAREFSYRVTHAVGAARGSEKR